MRTSRSGKSDHVCAPDAHTRRQFLQGASLCGLGLLTSAVGVGAGREAPAEAREPLRYLDPAEAQTLARIGEALVPGSASAGLVEYVDRQLAAAPADSMLMAKYLGLAPPLGTFYRGALAAVREALDRYDADVSYGGDRVRASARLAAKMLSGEVEHWTGPPAGLVCFVLRTDAIDVVYGTPEGFDRLGVPYMAHIFPATRWGA